MIQKSLVFLIFFLAVKFVLGQTDTSNSNKQLQELVISGIQAQDKRPITFSTLDSKRIQKLYYGADIPTILTATPSINMYSDNGTGIGYSAFRLRGMDQTRINTTINGIPVNDPENQGVYFNNFADLASSAEQIQVQRGIGTSTNGTSAFGGSVSILTRNLKESPEVRLYTGFGSFNSSRLSAEIQSGLLSKHWMFYARLGQVKTDGYRRHSGSLVQSYHFSLGYVKEKSILKFNFFGGNASNQLSYLGIDKFTFQNKPKSNDFINGETDAFKQYFNQVQYSYQINSKQSISASAYYVRSSAPKFQFLFPESWGYGFDFFNMESTSYSLNNGDTIYSPGNVMASYKLDQKFYGAFATYQYHSNRIDFTGGFHANSFSSDHFMEVNWANFVPSHINQNHQVYFNTGHKKEASAFVKMNYNLNENALVFFDVQLRQSTFSYIGKNLEYRPEFGKVENMSWMFLNPRFGSKLVLNQYFTGYLMLGYSQREPTRFDYLQDDFAPRDIKQNEIKPEQVVNLEFGTEIHGLVEGKINAYFMEFSNQIVGTGALNNFGYQITGNVGRSFRRGIEADLHGKFTKHFGYWINSSISKNQIEKLDQTYYNTDLNNSEVKSYVNAPLALSPNQIHQIGLQSFWVRNAITIDLSTRYVGTQYLDNTGDKNLSIPSFQTVDLLFGLNLQKTLRKPLPILSFRINNILNNNYASSGNLGGYNSIDTKGNRGQYSLYFPSATRNYFCTLTWQF
ncbi:MAG: TonB-dependent receptor [Bacteroidia bacterium]|nr:TonB-dependent receptor [Bacteroidia bacterium]MCF8426308.1 TonB-dependent receptor [Bacteroidia bacterium]MCF8447668.1 TonB-dependent receptor [Bacteroidia bacterium]